MDPQAPKQVSVSRDALRADLAEMELRLRIYFDEQLKHKADAAEVIEHSLTLSRFAKGEFTQAQVLTMEDIVETVLTERTTRGWTTRERWFGVLTVIIAVVSFILALSAASHGSLPIATG
jgi:hypothetical protein